jgi:hypothetical protein
MRCREEESLRRRNMIGEREGGRNIKAGDDGVLCRDWRREITTH